MVKTRLSDICMIQAGGTPSRSNPEYWKDGTIPWVKISDIKQKHLAETEEFISEQGLDNSSAKIFPKGTILFTIFATLGEVCILDIDAATNQAIAGITISSENVDRDYLYHYLRSKKLYVNSIGRGVAQNNINMGILRNLEILLPPLSAQESIAARLGKIDHSISLREQQLVKLDELVKARFVEMFGESRTNLKNWETVTLEQIADVGSSKRVFVEELQSEGIPFYRGTEIGALAEEKAISPELFITEDHYKSLCEATGAPSVGDLLMPSICSDGRIWLVDTDEPFYFKDGRVLWIHPTNPQIDSRFLQYFLKEKIATDYDSIASGTTFAELKIFSLKALGVMLPPIELQRQFAVFVEEAGKSKLTIQQSLDKLEVLKKALMQEYFG